MTKTTREILGAITPIKETFKAISATVEVIHQSVLELISSTTFPAPRREGPTNNVKQMVIEFEKETAWDPKIGALRIGLLPQAEPG